MKRETRYEVWDIRMPKVCACCKRITSRNRFVAGYWGNPGAAILQADWTRQRVRIRTFYDRHLRARVVQFLMGRDF